MAKVTDHLQTRKNGPYDFIVVDEAQDIGVAELRLLAAMGAGSEAQEDALFFAGDLGQRIFQPPFSWKSLGVEIRGRSRTLKINYRTSHQIRRQADRLLPPELTDVDGNSENRKGTISVFNGPEPMIETFDDEQSEINAVACWLKQQIDEGIAAHEIGVFIRSSAQMSRAQESVNQAGLNGLDLQDQFETQSDHVSICAMHLAKGLEFRGVVVMACDDEVLPLQERIEAITDHADLQEVYSTERHLLYVSCTRARDHLYITGVAPISEFIDDLKN
jgi:superfamily I DNA/RNA helicase